MATFRELLSATKSEIREVDTAGAEEMIAAGDPVVLDVREPDEYEQGALEGAILELLTRRSKGASICPSEAARLLESEEARWRPLLEPARSAARRLARQGRIEILKGGRRIDPDDVRGPIRLRAL